jgi:hypothetical protein
MERRIEEKEHWVSAAKVIHHTANGLSDRGLKKNLFEVERIREIFSKAEK